MKEKNTTNRVKSQVRGFEQYYQRLPHNELVPVRKEMMSRLGWSVSLFYYKKRGDTPIWKHEAMVINEIFSRFGFNMAS